MSATPSPRSAPPTRPPGPWPACAALAVPVLLAHLWLLGVRPAVAADPPAQRPPLPVAPPTGAAPGHGDPSPALATPTAVQVTQVRWESAPAPATIKVSERPQKPEVRAPRAPAAPSAAPPPAGAPVPAANATAAATETQALPPSQPPGSARLPYDIEGQVKGLTYRASGQLDWTLADGRYQARMELSMFLLGKRVQTSVGSVGPEGLRPERFSDQRKTEVATHFEREQGRIRFSNNAPEAALLPGAQDRLSLFLQVAGLLRAGQLREGGMAEFQVAGTGDAEPWRFEIGGLQTLSLPAGEIPARWVRRLPRKPHDSTVEFWLAPSLDHLPVRLRITQANGDVADQRLARLP